MKDSKIQTENYLQHELQRYYSLQERCDVYIRARLDLQLFDVEGGQMFPGQNELAQQVISLLIEIEKKCRQQMEHELKTNIVFLEPYFEQLIKKRTENE